MKLYAIIINWVGIHICIDYDTERPDGTKKNQRQHQTRERLFKKPWKEVTDVCQGGTGLYRRSMVTPSTSPDQYTSPPLTLWMVRYFSVISVLILLALAASLIILPLVLPPLPPPPLMLLFVPIAIMLLLFFLAFASADTVAPSL